MSQKWTKVLFVNVVFDHIYFNVKYLFCGLWSFILEKIAKSLNRKVNFFAILSWYKWPQNKYFSYATYLQHLVGVRSTTKITNRAIFVRYCVWNFNDFTTVRNILNTVGSAYN